MSQTRDKRKLKKGWGPIKVDLKEMWFEVKRKSRSGVEYARYVRTLVKV